MPTAPPPSGRTGRITGLAGKCVDAARANAANGTAINLYTCNGTNGTLYNPASNKCLDVTDNNPADGTRLQIWDCFAGANQRWTLP